ncbi:MAG TPA: hypothetical protein VKG63_00970 [Steroidobacteraceae bacterium]|nr:hypothetical protein [Steroidobacteraceae bacterium]
MMAWRRRIAGAPRFLPLLGFGVGAVGGGVYWAGAQIWPTSVAVVLSMLATALLTARTDEGSVSDVHASSERASSERASNSELAGFVFAVLLKYSALMALSAAKLPYPLPANLALGVIMIAGHASSRALVVSVLASAAHPASKPAASGDLIIALGVGFAPAVLIGVPGLVGLAAAIVARIACIAWIRRSRPSVTAAELDMIRQRAEVSFYLGALASWAYI